MTDESTSPPMLVIHLTWTADGAGVCQETYGPWIPDDDLTHMAAITEFMRDHQRLTGCRFDTAVMAIVQDPAGWVREAQERAAYHRAAVEAGVMSKDEAARRSLVTGE
jgi:hypothetical protein